MAIYDHQYGGLEYFRVYRAWGGKEYQEYVRIKKSRSAAYKKAQAIDAKLEKTYQVFLRIQVRQAEHHVRKNGTIRGLRRLVVSRPNREESEVFELRINVPWHAKVKRTTISISVHGPEKAFDLALEKIFGWYELSADCPAAKAMRDCENAYLQTSSQTNIASAALLKARNEFESLAGGVVKSLKRFRSPA